LGRLGGQGYLDDAEYARAVASHRLGSRGGAAIAAELASKGVARAVAQAAVADLDPERELEAAESFARRWLPRAAPGSLRSLLSGKPAGGHWRLPDPGQATFRSQALKLARPAERRTRISFLTARVPRAVPKCSANPAAARSRGSQAPLQTNTR